MTETASIPKELFKHIRGIQIRAGRLVTDFFAGAYQSAFKGRGIEFEDVREYQPGDEIRTIDWNVTARMNNPFVKNFREEREQTVMLIVDVSSSSWFGSVGKQKREIIAEIGALLAFSAIRNQDKVGLILFTSQIELYIPPKKGLSHILRVIRELLVFQPKHQGTNLQSALEFLARVQKRKGICFLMSDFLADDYQKQLSHISRKHDLISLCITDPKEIEFPDVGLINIMDLETGQYLLVDTSQPDIRRRLQQRAEQRISLTKNLMKRFGADFIDIRSDEDYTTPLKECFRLRERRR